MQKDKLLVIVFIANIPKHVNELDMPLVENLSLILATINMTNLQTYNLGQKVGGKFIKLSKIGFEKTSKFGFSMDGRVLAIKSKHFRDFLWRFSNFLIS